MEEFLRSLDLTTFNLAGPVLTLVHRLLNYLETLLQERQALRAEVQQARDEIARLQGLKARPTFKANRPAPVLRPHPAARAAKKVATLDTPLPPRAERIKIDREAVLPLEPASLPPTFRSTGYREVVIQNIRFQTDNVCYRLERGYALDTGQFYEADLPAGVSGQSFGVELRAFVLMLYYELRVTEDKILALLLVQGLVISAGEIAAIVTTKHLSLFDAERRAILRTGLQTTDYQQIDDTALRVAGVNHHCSVLGNPRYAAFFIHRYKNRMVVADLLTCRRLDEEPPHALPALPEPLALPAPATPAPPVLPALREAIPILLGDDAPQFDQQTQHRALCWIHEERHYAKLHPLLPVHQQLLEAVRTEFWAYYERLKAYAATPSPEAKAQLWLDFDRLFDRTTGYDDLDHRLALTRAKKRELLIVLDFPDVPLHNNQAERDLREVVVKRKISSGPRGPDGAQAWEVYFTLLLTCRRQGINFYAYLCDRIAHAQQMPALAELVGARAPTGK